MNYEARYWSLLPGYTEYLANICATYFVAAGSSASALAKDVKSTAQDMAIELPYIYLLSRQESHDMYSRSNAEPIRVLRAILDREKENDRGAHYVNFIEDYTINAAKSQTLDARLIHDPSRRGEVFYYHILVAASAYRRNMHVHCIDPILADYLDNKFNRQEYQFDERS